LPAACAVEPLSGVVPVERPNAPGSLHSFIFSSQFAPITAHMRRRIALLLAIACSAAAWAAPHSNGVKVGVERAGNVYALQASFDTQLTTCAAFKYLTDYEAATNLPGIVSSTAVREAEHRVRVERTAKERILFFPVHLHSILEFTEYPNQKLAFVQLSGDSKTFEGYWLIEPNLQGSTLRFEGKWEPDTLIPLFIIDHFARHDLEKRFGEIARLAEEQKAKHAGECL